MSCIRRWNEALVVYLIIKSKFFISLFKIIWWSFLRSSCHLRKINHTILLTNYLNLSCSLSLLIKVKSFRIFNHSILLLNTWSLLLTCSFRIDCIKNRLWTTMLHPGALWNLITIISNKNSALFLMKLNFVIVCIAVAASLITLWYRKLLIVLVMLSFEHRWRTICFLVTALYWAFVKDFIRL